MEHDRKIGIIGGMGPAATWLFYRYVTEMTEASCDQDHVNMVILSDAAMPDRTAAILSGKEEPVMKKMREDVKTLVGCGCEAVAVTCNTAHFFMEKVAKETQGSAHSHAGRNRKRSGVPGGRRKNRNSGYPRNNPDRTVSEAS